MHEMLQAILPSLHERDTVNEHLSSAMWGHLHVMTRAKLKGTPGLFDQHGDLTAAAFAQTATDECRLPLVVLAHKYDIITCGDFANIMSVLSKSFRTNGAKAVKRDSAAGKFYSKCHDAFGTL